MVSPDARARMPPSEPAPAALIDAARTTNCAPMVHDVIRLTPNIVEVVVRAPMAARAFQPGQFYRLQNYETLSRRARRHRARRWKASRSPARRSIARKDCSRPSCSKWAARPICARCSKPGEPVILMGPTGTPTETPSSETVLLVGGGLGNAVLFSIGQELRANGIAVIYFAGYKKIDRPLQGRRDREGRRRRRLVLRRSARLHARPGAGQGVRRQHRRGMDAYGGRARRRPPIPLERGRPPDRDRLRRHDGGGQPARHGVLAPYLKPGSQRHRQHQLADAVHDEGDLRPVPAGAQDPVTGEETVVFSCFNQDQRSTTSTSATCARASRRTACRRS